MNLRKKYKLNKNTKTLQKLGGKSAGEFLKTPYQYSLRKLGFPRSRKIRLVVLYFLF